MKEELKKAWRWTKEHAGEIITFAACTAVIGTGLYVCLGNRKSSVTTYPWNSAEPVKSKTIYPSLGVGIVEDANEYGNGVRDFWVNNLKISDIGKFGEGIKQAYSDVTDDHTVWALIQVDPPKMDP